MLRGRGGDARGEREKRALAEGRAGEQRAHFNSNTGDTRGTTAGGEARPQLSC